MRIGVLGVGSAGGRLARLAGQLGHETIGFDPKPRAQVEGLRPATSPQEAIEAGDAVIVASPTALHAEQATEALRAGKPVFVEKPLAVSAREAEPVVALAEESKAVAAVGVNLRFHPAVEGLLELVQSGELGDVRLAKASFGYALPLWRPNRDYRETYSARRDQGGGVLLDAIHELDYLNLLLGLPSSVSALATRVSGLDIDVEDTVIAHLAYDNGAVATVDLNFFEPAYRRGCLLVGSDASAAWDWNEAKIRVRRAGRGDRVIDVSCDLLDTYRGELADFVRSIEEGTEPRGQVRSGLDALRVADAIRASSSSGNRQDIV